MAALTGLCSVLVQLQDPGPAVVWGKRAVAAAPRNAYARLILGDALAAASDQPAAIAEWREASLLDPSLNEARDVLSDPDARKAYDEGRAPKRVAYGSSAAFDPEAASKAGTLNIPVANPDFAGPLIAAAFSFFIGLFLLFLVETQWVFFLWPLRFMALGSLFASVLLAHSAMKVKQRGNTRATRSRAASIFSEALFWAVSLALLGSIIAALYLL